MRSAGVVFNLFLASSRLQKKRAVLTIASIAWGSVALLLLLAFGQGLREQLSVANRGMGTSIAVIWASETTKVWQGLPAGRSLHFLPEDVPLVKARVPLLNGAIGEFVTWGVNFSYGKKTVNAQLIGTDAAYGDLRNHVPIPGGRFLSEEDVALRRRVVFLGGELSHDLFGDTDPIGKTMLVNSMPYTVIGVLEKRLQMGTYGGPDKNHAVIPISTFEAQIGKKYLGNLVVRATDPAMMKTAIEEIRKVFAAKYGFDPEDDRALRTWDTVAGQKVMTNILYGIQIFLGVIGGLTLMIGGVGVANIMYATVKERTREFGVKMALGARPGWITGPLVLEGLAYTIFGGLLGLLFAMVIIIGLGFVPVDGNEALQFLGKPTLSPAVGAISAGILGLIGLVAAYFPARRAASIDPAQTLRYE
jgi:putative ABC transport system permease protein